MSHQQFYNNLNIFRILFNAFGIDLQPTEDGSILKGPINFLLHMLCVLVWIVGMFAYVLKYLNDFDKATEALTVFTQCILGLAKLITFLLKRQKFIGLFKEVQLMALKGNIKERELLNVENQRSEFVASIYYNFVRITAAICIAIAWLSTALIYFRTGEFVAILPLSAIFPFDYSEYAYIRLPLLYISNLYFLNITVHAIVGIDSLFGYFVFNVTAHYRVLSLKLQSTSEALEVHKNSEMFYNKYIEMICYHRSVLAITEKFNLLFHQITFFEVSFTCLQLCLCMYQLTSERNLSKSVFTFMVFASVMVQLLIYCLGGQEVQTECNKICLEFYTAFPWHQMTPKMRRSMLLPIMRAQRVQSLTGYFFTVNRALLVWIFRTAGSFSTLIFAVKKQTVEPLQ